MAHESKKADSSRSRPSSCIVKTCLLAGTNAADRGSAIGALALRDGLAVLRRALDGILHFLLRLALDAICFDGHSYKPLYRIDMGETKSPFHLKRSKLYRKQTIYL